MKISEILSDSPSNNDKFTTHEKISDALHEIIENQEGGKTIGLEGDWGSGKSTIVEIFSSRYSGLTKTTVFNFDTWVHQGEPLRRVFLESLINHLLNLGWLTMSEDEENFVNLNFWITLKNKLSGNLREVTKKSTSKFSYLLKTFLISILLLPLGFSLISVGARETTIKSWSLDSLALNLGILLTTAPFFLIIISLIWTKMKKESNEEIWNIFLKKTETIESAEITGEKEPTSIEFQDNFKKLLEIGLRYKKRKIVIILDNLDRADSDELKEIWAVLRSFIANSEFSKEVWLKKLWVIIPYSKEKLKIKDGDEEPTLDENFLEKLFQVKFYVPPLTLSAWKNHLSYLLDAAFGVKIDFVEKHEIFILFAKEMAAEITPPSPRRLLTFVNSIVAVDLQWPEIPISHKALYVILREKYKSNSLLTKMVSGEVPSVNNRQSLGEEISNSISVLFFNVEKEIARQILFREKIKISLQDSSGELLKNNYLQIGFPEIFALEIRNEFNIISEQNNNNFINSIFSILNSNITKGSNQTKLQIENSLGYLISKIKLWPITEKNSIAAIESLIKIGDNKEINRELISCIKRTTDWFVINKITIENKQIFNLMRIASEFLSNEYLIKYFNESHMPRFLIPATESEWIKLYVRSRKLKNEIDFDKFTTSFNNKELYLWITRGSDTLEAFEVIFILNYLIRKEDVEMESAIESLGDRMMQDTSSRKSDLLPILAFLLELSENNKKYSNLSNSILEKYLMTKFFIWDIEDISSGDLKNSDVALLFHSIWIKFPKIFTREVFEKENIAKINSIISELS